MTHRNQQVLVIHNLPTGQGAPVWRESDAGVLDEAKSVGEALTKLRVTHRVVGAASLADLPHVLGSSPERIVFNLVEEFRDLYLGATYVPAICEAYGKVTTGGDTPCLVGTLDKWRTKALLKSAGISTPAAALVEPGKAFDRAEFPEGTVIVKPVCADASEGISSASVIRGSADAIEAAVKKIHADFRQPALVEQFIDGRELNVSLLQKDDKVEVLAIAEIDFSRYGSDRPRIVDYAAKWIEDSFEFKNTPRVVPAPLTEKEDEAVREVALQAWLASGCRDYARVDLRIDANGLPFILEVNANPDISPAGGYAAALAVAKVPFENFISIILRNARRRMGALIPPETPEPPAAKPSTTRAGITICPSEAPDREPILQFLKATGFFRPDELEIARDVLQSALKEGAAGHYQSFTAMDEGTPVGWLCFGPTPCCLGTYDIYWLGVDPGKQRGGVGAALTRHAEKLIKERGGRLVIVETSGRTSYDPTRRFYEKHAYIEAARIKEFYAPGDDKVIYTKLL